MLPTFPVTVLPVGVQLLQKPQQLSPLPLCEGGEHLPPPLGLLMLCLLRLPHTCLGKADIHCTPVGPALRAGEQSRVFQLGYHLAGGAGLDAQALRELPLGDSACLR